MLRVNELEAQSQVTAPGEGNSQQNLVIPLPSIHQNVGLQISKTLAHHRPQPSTVGSKYLLSTIRASSPCWRCWSEGRWPDHNQRPSGITPGILPPPNQPLPPGIQHHTQGHHSSADDIIPGINKILPFHSQWHKFWHPLRHKSSKM